MLKDLKKIRLIGLLMFLVAGKFYAQVSVTSATACPNQQAVFNASWNNVAVSSYTICKNPVSCTVQASPQFTVTDAGPGPANVPYTITASGAALSGPVTSSTTATLTIITPAPLTVTPITSNYCYGQTATLTADVGSAFNYSLTGPTGTFPPSSSNIITIGNLLPTYTGVYHVTANFAGCIRTGTAQIGVSPNSQMTVSNPTNVCQQSTVTLTASLPSSTGGYTWTLPNYSTVQVQNLTLPAIQNSLSGTYTVSSQFSYGTVPNTITCARSATTSVTVVQTSTVAITASPSKTLCEGANLNLSVASSVTANYSWAGPSAFNSTSPNPSINNVNSANTGVYTVTALFTNGALTCPTVAVVNVSIVSTADPTYTAPTNICQNGIASLSVNATGANPNGYSWSGPNFASTAKDTSFNIQNNQSGIYYVHATFGNIGCIRTKSLTINVIPVNSITIYPPAPVCQPDNGYLQANAIGATTFSWDGPNGNVGHTPSVIIYHPSLSATGIYTITVGFGSGPLTCYNSNTTALQVNPLLTFTLPPPQTVCFNSTVNISGPAGATGYSWTSSSGFGANTQNIELDNIQPDRAGTYSLQVSLNGCITSASTSVQVLDPIQFPQPFFDQTICRGDTIFLEAPITGGSGNNSITWDPGIYLTAVTGSATGGVPLQSTVYNVSAHDIVCPDYSISADVNITVKQPPQVNLAFDRIEGCAPLCQSYNAHSGPETAWVTYNFGSNIVYQQDSVYACLYAPGVYTLNVMSTGTNGCSGSTVFPLPINVYPTPTLNITTTPESPTITDDIVFNAASDYSLTSYMWVFSNAGAAGDETDTSLVAHPQMSYINSGSFPVLLIGTTDMGCTDTTLSLLQVRENFNVFIPNCFTPNHDDMNDVFQIKGSGINPDKFSMELFDRKGGTLFSTSDLNTGWDGTKNGSKVQQDVYVYKVTVVGLHGEGKKEYVGHFTLLR